MYIWNLDHNIPAQRNAKTTQQQCQYGKALVHRNKGPPQTRKNDWPLKALERPPTIKTSGSNGTEILHF